MTVDRIAQGCILAAEMPLLLFHAAGVALGVEAAAVEQILDAGQARESGIESRNLAALLGAGGAPPPASAGKLLLRGRDVRCGLDIDSLDEIVTIPTTALQPLPEPLASSRGHRLFWGGIVRENKVVLLVDLERLHEAPPGML